MDETYIHTFLSLCLISQTRIRHALTYTFQWGRCSIFFAHCHCRSKCLPEKRVGIAWLSVVQSSQVFWGRLTPPSLEQYGIDFERTSEGEVSPCWWKSLRTWADVHTPAHTHTFIHIRQSCVNSRVHTFRSIRICCFNSRRCFLKLSFTVNTNDSYWAAVLNSVLQRRLSKSWISLFSEALVAFDCFSIRLSFAAAAFEMSLSVWRLSLRPSRTAARRRDSLCDAVNVCNHVAVLLCVQVANVPVTWNEVFLDCTEAVWSCIPKKDSIGSEVASAICTHTYDSCTRTNHMLYSRTRVCVPHACVHR